MAEQLLTTSIQAPGFQGINNQDSAVGLDSGFATRADNCVIDKYGRIGARQGWEPVHTAIGALTGDVEFITEFNTIDGTAYTLAGGNNKLFRLNGSTLTQLTYGGGGVAPTITANHWSAASLNSRLYLYQAGHDPLVYDPALSTTAYRRISEHPDYLGTVQQSNTAISAFGRVWTAGDLANKSQIQFSDILNGCIVSTGTAGVLDVSSVWPDGEDEIVSLAAHNGFLFVFGRRQILVYARPDDPYAMHLQDTVTGVGCLARDSVVVAGTDVLFLSDTGVRSMQRTIQEKSAPMREVSLNVKDDLLMLLETETTSQIKAVYSDVHAFYLLSLPENAVTYCFDLRQLLPNGASRTTTWSSINPKSFYYNNSKELLIGSTRYVGKYTGYSDNGSSYTMSYYTNYFDFGQPTTIKILKKIAATFIGNAPSSVNIRWGFEYQDSFYSRTAALEVSSVGYYGESEFGVSMFTTGTFVNTQRVNAGGAGNVLQIGIESVIKGNLLSIQRLDCYVKQGKTF